VTRRQGYRFRLKPTQAEAATLRCFVGCSRFVWNEVLAQNELRHERGEKRLGFKAMCEYLVHLKGEYPFLREVHSQPLQQTLKDLATAYRRAFDPKPCGGFPTIQEARPAAGHPLPAGFCHRRPRRSSAEGRLDRLSQEPPNRWNAKERYGVA